MGTNSNIMEIKRLNAGVYQIKCLVNGKVYIGSSECIPTRVQNHLSELKSKKHYSKDLQEDFNKYGEEGFHAEVLKYMEEGDIFVQEKLFIRNCDSEMYNSHKYESKAKKISVEAIEIAPNPYIGVPVVFEECWGERRIVYAKDLYSSMKGKFSPKLIAAALEANDGRVCYRRMWKFYEAGDELENEIVGLPQ
jgi:group I intron endonuclease